MFTDKDSIQVKVGYGNYISLGQYLVEAKFQYNKLWGEDTGRNLAGKQTGTLIGIFPKLVLEFRKLTKEELEIIVPILDASKQTVKYYDPYKRAINTMETYTGDYEISNKNLVGTFVDNNGITSIRKNEGFSVSFIAREKRQ